MSLAAMEEVQNQPEERTLKAEQTLFSWRGPVRPFKERPRQFFSTVILIAILLSIIGYVLEGIMVVVLIWAVVFLTFVLFKVPPGEIDYTISNRYVRLGNQKYDLREIRRFWIVERWQHKLLVFDIPLHFPGRLELVMGDIDEAKLKEDLGKYIEFEEEAPGFADRTASWLSKHLLLDS